MLFKDSQKCYDNLKKQIKNQKDPNKIKALRIALRRCYNENRPVDFFEIQDIQDEMKNIFRNEYDPDEISALVLGFNIGSGSKIFDKYLKPEMIKDYKRYSNVKGKLFRKGLEDGKLYKENISSALFDILDYNNRYSKENVSNQIFSSKKKR